MTGAQKKKIDAYKLMDSQKKTHEYNLKGAQQIDDEYELMDSQKKIDEYNLKGAQKNR